MFTTARGSRAVYEMEYGRDGFVLQLVAELHFNTLSGREALPLDTALIPE
jgi:hypothetical protein